MVLAFAITCDHGHNLELHTLTGPFLCFIALLIKGVFCQENMSSFKQPKQVGADFYSGT